MLSDNGTNFKGIERASAEHQPGQSAANDSQWGCEMAIQPTTRPTFRWSSWKYDQWCKEGKAIYAILQNADIRDEELITACTEAEALVNSRPLTYQSANAADVTPLTPNHFLHGQIGGQFAPDIVDSTKFNSHRRWRRVQELMKHLAAGVAVWTISIQEVVNSTETWVWMILCWSFLQIPPKDIGHLGEFSKYIQKWESASREGPSWSHNHGETNQQSVPSRSSESRLVPTYFTYYTQWIKQQD